MNTSQITVHCLSLPYLYLYHLYRKRLPALWGWGYRRVHQMHLRPDSFPPVVLIAKADIKYEQSHSNRNIVYSCKYHIVSVHYRRKYSYVRLKELMQSIAAENHLSSRWKSFQRCTSAFGVGAEFTKLSRANVEDTNHLTTKLPTLWTNSYFCSTVGGGLRS